MNRRGFLGSILAACAAPAIVRADSLMRIVPRETAVIVTPNALEVNWEAYTREVLRVLNNNLYLANAASAENAYLSAVPYGRGEYRIARPR